MQIGGTVLYVDEVSPVVDFYRRAFGLEVRFFDETLGFAELDTGGSTLAIAAHSLGEMLMQDGYSRPADGHPLYHSRRPGFVCEGDYGGSQAPHSAKANALGP
jgi:hypothetical protein